MTFNSSLNNHLSDDTWGCLSESGTLSVGGNGTHAVVRDVVHVAEAPQAPAINERAEYSLVAAPWGGFERSGSGRDDGMSGVEKHVQTKTAWVNYG